MKLGDCLQQDNLNKIASITIKKGNVYRIYMDKSNGIVPKQGDEGRNKFFVVLGFDNTGKVYGGVIINSKINQGLPNDKKILMMPIQVAKYGFLQYDSFVDCCKLKNIDIDTFQRWEYKGDIDEDDIELIIGTLCESQYEQEIRLKMFGIK